MNNMGETTDAEGDTGMTTSELRFRSPGLSFYSGNLGISVLGLALVVFGLFDLAVDPWNWGGALFILGGVFVTLLGAALALFVWFTLILGTVSSWRQWRQFRPPAVVIDDSGVRYLASRGPVLIPWLDIEQICLDRTILRASVVTKVSLRLAPHAALLHDGKRALHPDRYLNIGLAADLSVPESVAVGFLAQTAGSRLEITEEDRRPILDDHGRR
jgi:hypothetical protein